MSFRNACGAAAGIALACATPVVTLAQTEQPGEIIKSLGQPPIVRPNGFLSIGSYTRGEADETTGYLSLSLHKPFANPAVAAVYATLEGYAGVRGDKFDGGLRSQLYIPLIRLAPGLDYNFEDKDLDFTLSLIHPIRRGGIFGHGTQLRLDWIPGRGHSLNFGITFPVAVPHQGRTRTNSDYVKLPKATRLSLTPVNARTPALNHALGNVTISARWINLLTTPYLDQNGDDRAAALDAVRAKLAGIESHLATPSLLGGPRTPDDDVRVYHAELERAFSLAAGESGLAPGESTELGRRLADLARATLLDEVVIPYNRLLGQRKRRDSTLAFAEPARATFAGGLGAVSLEAGRGDDVVALFETLLGIVEGNRKLAKEEWEDDERLAWLPLQYGLRPDQHDEREELNALVERVVGTPFIPGNDVWYIANDQFAWEVAKMIERAERYHVLWLHDFRGVDGAGNPDDITFLVMTKAYLGALTERVKAYDETGSLPVYIVIQDQMFYEMNKSRPALKILENPLEAKVGRFPDGYEYMQVELEDALRGLREAVAGSTRLQADAARYGAEWLRNRVKVQVNVTHPADPTFWSRQMLPLVGVLDVMIRDHRKISFYDISEDDPYAGQAVYSGMGIGEHYTGASWEDRALIVQGPELLSLRNAAIEVLKRQDFSDEQIPFPLRPRPKPADYDERVAAHIAERPWRGRLLDIHNVNGFGRKPFTVFKATLYSMMPPGSVTILPDHLWNNPFWGGLLVGNALRGGKVLMISPSLAAHPGGAAAPVASRTQELFERMVLAQQALGDEIEAAGGLLRAGFYDVKVDARDAPARAKLAFGGFRETPWLRELWNFDEGVYELEAVVDEAARTFEVRHLFEDATERPPTLHMKVNFSATPEGWGILSHPGLVPALRTHIEQRLRILDKPDVYVDPRDAASEVRKAWFPHVEAYLASLGPDQQDRAAAFLTVGSHNQDYRSMILDGEVGATVSGLGAFVAIGDLMFMTGSATWVDTLEELEEMYPTYGEFVRKVGRFIRIAI